MSSEPEFVPLTIEELQVYFPQYEILTFIAAGGMGAVYLANQKSIDRKVAIKVLPQELSSDEEFSAQFRAEAKVMSRVNHPNLVGFFDFGEVAGMLFIVMEFVDGKSLHHSAHGDAISPNVALDIVIGLSEGVKHAHDAGIIHRDIKPANVLLDQKATPKLGDFGLARPVEESEAGKVIFGTPGYTAPEVVKNPESIDERADIFSIGAILYELVTGHLPQDSYTPPSKEQKMHADFDKIVKKAILPDPDLRYGDMDDFLVALNNLKEKLDSGDAEEELIVSNVNKTSAPRATVKLASAKPPREVKLSAQTSATAKPIVTSGAAKTSAAHTSATNVNYQRERKAKSDTSKLVNIAITGVIVALVGIFIFSKVLKGKSGEDQAETPEVTPVAVVPDSTTEVKAPEVVKESSLDKLYELADPLKEHDFSKLPEGSFKVDTFAYFFYDEPQTWMNAQREAERYGGSLACPSTVELTEKFLTEMEKEGGDEVWTGGGTFDGLKMSWINGESWHFKSFSPKKQGALSFSKDGDFQISPHGDPKKFFICWDLSGRQHGEIHRQLRRITKAAQENDIESLPPRAFVEAGAIYYVYLRRATFKEAERIAEKYKAKIATPLSDQLYKKMRQAVSRCLMPDDSAWLEGKIMRDGSVEWDAELQNPKVWLEQLGPNEKVLGIRLVNASKPGLKGLDKTSGAEAMILKWDIQQ